MRIVHSAREYNSIILSLPVGAVYGVINKSPILLYSASMNKSEAIGKVLLPGGKTDFGNTEAEQMGRNFIEVNFSFVEKTEPASDYDDRKAETRFDYVIYAGGKIFLGVQQKFSGSAERAKEAIKMILAKPLAQLHNNPNIVNPEKFPVVVIHGDIKEWGEAYNRFLVEKLASPTDALVDRVGLTRKFLSQMLHCLKTEKYYFPQHSEIFDTRILVLEKELPRLNKK